MGNLDSKHPKLKSVNRESQHGITIRVQSTIILPSTPPLKSLSGTHYSFFVLFYFSLKELHRYIQLMLVGAVIAHI